VAATTWIRSVPWTRKLRHDLYFRLNVLRIDVPRCGSARRHSHTGRALPEEIRFRARLCGGPAFATGLGAARVLRVAGNVRELENLMERAAVVSAGAPWGSSTSRKPDAGASRLGRDEEFRAAQSASRSIESAGRSVGNGTDQGGLAQSGDNKLQPRGCWTSASGALVQDQALRNRLSSAPERSPAFFRRQILQGAIFVVPAACPNNDFVLNIIMLRSWHGYCFVLLWSSTWNVRRSI